MVKTVEQLKEKRRIYLEEKEAKKNAPKKPNNRGRYIRKPEQAQKIKATQLRRVADGVHNRSIKSQCPRCGLIGQKFMIDRWHNKKCKALVSATKITEWSYISPKLRGLKVRT